MPQEAAPVPSATGRRTVLVTHADEGAGGRLALLLLRRSHRVRAVVSDSGSRAASNLDELGAEVVTVDWSLAGSVREAADGVDAACVMGLSLGANPDAVRRHGANAVDGLKEAGVPFVVYGSEAGSDRGTGVPALDAQRDVERRLVSSGIPHAIVGSTFLMESLLAPPLVEGLRDGVLRLPLRTDKRLQMLAFADLADFCARVIEDPRRYQGRRIDIASDEQTGPDVARILSDVSRRSLRFEEISAEEAADGIEGAERLYHWLQQGTPAVDIAALHREHVDVSWLTLRQWATMQDWTLLEAEARERRAR